MSTELDLLSFVKSNDLFRHLAPDQLRLLLPYLKVVQYKKGEWLMKEGDTSQHLVLIRMGKAEIVKNEQIVDILNPGDWAGEMAHIEMEPRSASIRALEDTEAITILLTDLKESPALRTVYDRLIPEIAKKISARLRKTGNELIATLNEKLELTQARNQISRTIIYMMILFAIFFNVIAVYNGYSGELKSTFNLFFMPSSIFIFGTGAIRLINKSGYPLSFYGITTHRAGRVCLESILVTLPLLGLLALIKWAAITSIPSLAGTPFLSIVHSTESMNGLILSSAVYILLVPAQELVVRGVLQSSFRNFFHGPNRVFHAILSSNILFEVLHTGNNLVLAVFSFIFGIFWGALYEHQKSVLGAIISHMLIGWWGMYALDLLSLLPSPAT